MLVADKLFRFEAFMALLTPVILIGGMASGLFTPTEAAVAAVAWALFLGFVWYRTLNFRMLVKVSMDTIETTATVLFIVASASIFAWVLTTTQVTDAIAVWVLSISRARRCSCCWPTCSCCSSAASWRRSPRSRSWCRCSCRSSPSWASTRCTSASIMVLNLMIGLLTPPVGMVLFVLQKVANISFEAPCGGGAVADPAAAHARDDHLLPQIVLWLPSILFDK